MHVCGNEVKRWRWMLCWCPGRGGPGYFDLSIDAVTAQACCNDDCSPAGFTTWTDNPRLACTYWPGEPEGVLTAPGRWCGLTETYAEAVQYGKAAIPKLATIVRADMLRELDDALAAGPVNFERHQACESATRAAKAEKGWRL